MSGLITMLLLPVPYDNCVGVPISRLSTYRGVNLIVKTDCETDESFNSTSSGLYCLLLLYSIHILLC